MKEEIIFVWQMGFLIEMLSITLSLAWNSLNTDLNALNPPKSFDERVNRVLMLCSRLIKLEYQWQWVLVTKLIQWRLQSKTQSLYEGMEISKQVIENDFVLSILV